YLSYLENPEAYNASHPFSDVYPGEEFGPKLVELMNAFATQMSYGYTRTLETGERLNRWVDIVDAFLGTDVFDTRLDEFVNILSFMWGDCNWLNGKSITDGSVWWSNWRIVANAGFFKAVEFLPEFTTHDEWRAKVEGNVEYTLDLLYNDDMSFTEAGPSYNAWCVKLFGDCIKAANMSGNPMSEEFMGKVQYAARNALESYYPNGYDTNIGDSNYRDQMYYFEMLDKVFNEKDSIIHSYVTGDGSNAEYLSSFYSSVNSAYMRNSWNPDEAVYVNFTNNPNDGHYHPDSNQVLMYAYGQPLLVDSGRYSYSSTNSIYNELRYASAHNTVEAVGVSMGNHSSSATANSMTYTSNSAFDFVTNEQHGYSGVSHTRNVLFFKEGYAIVTDYVKGSNASQEYRQNWHFLPSNNAVANGSMVKTNFYKKPNIVIANAGAGGTVRSGYHSADYGLVANSEYASFSKTGDVVKFDTVLYPTDTGESADITVTDLAPDDNSKAVIEIGGDVNGVYYVKNADASDGKFDNYKTDAKMAYVINNEYAMANGKTLDGQDGSLISSPAAVDSIRLSVSGDTLYVDGENLVAAKNEETAVKINVGAVSKVYLNGEEVELKTDADGNIVSVASTNIADGLGDVIVGNIAYNVTGENLVPDGGFTAADGNFSWGTWESPNGTNGYFKDKCEDWFYKVNRDTNEAGLYMSGSVTADDYALGTRWNDGTYGLCSMANFIPVEAGKTYYISYDYKHKSNNVGAGYIMTSFKSNRDNYESGTSPYIPAAATTQWQKAETVITAPEDGYVYFHFRWLGDGSNTGNGPFWYFDNFNVSEAEAIENIYNESATVTVNYVDADGNAIADPDGPAEAAEGAIYTASAPETITYNGKVYIFNSAKSVLTTKIVKGENVLTAVYDKSEDSSVTVKFVDENGIEFKSAEVVLVGYGTAVDESTITIEDTIIDGDKAYIFKSADGFGEVSDGTDKEVTLNYESFDVETKTVSALKSTTVAGTTGAYTNYSTSGEDNIPARMMMDNRSTAGKNRFSIIDIGEVSSEALKVTLQLRELESGGSYDGTYSAYDASDLGTEWDPTNVSGVSITGEAVGTGTASGTTVTFDLTEAVQNGIRVYALRKNSNGYVIMGGTTTSVPPVISVTAIKNKTITEIKAPADIEVAYAGTVTLPTTVKAIVDGEETTLDIISCTPSEFDTRTAGTVNVTATVEIPDKYALADGVSNQVTFAVIVKPEPDATEFTPYGVDTVSVVSGQNEAGIYSFGGKITREATFDFDLTVNTAANSLIGINNSSNMTSSNYFAGSSIFMLINNGKLVVRNGNTNDAGIAVTEGETYHISITTDVEADTFSAVISDGEGNALHSVTDYAYRTNTDYLDCLVCVDNNGVSGAYTISNFKITTNSLTPELTIKTVPELRVLTDGETGEVTLGLAFTAYFNGNINLIEKAGFDYGANAKDENGNYVVKKVDLNLGFEQLSTDSFRMVIKGISNLNSVRDYSAQPYVVVGGEKIQGEIV
ncbi:MAG: heparinase II/III family protein, partial [Clostridia bacterium]